jgi:hypothetical protein
MKTARRVLAALPAELAAALSLAAQIVLLQGLFIAADCARLAGNHL